MLYIAKKVNRHIVILELSSFWALCISFWKVTCMFCSMQNNRGFKNLLDHYFSCIGPGVLACATRGGGRSEAGHCFHLLFSFFLSFFYAFYFSPTSEKLPWLNICFPTYFGITRRNILKKDIYRVSHKTVSTLFFVIFRLPKQLQ